MAQGSAPGSNIDKKFVDVLIADLISLSYQAKKKYPPVKEAAEACQLKARSIGQRSDQISRGLLDSSVDLVQPFVLGCDTKCPKIVQLSLTSMQRHISHRIVNQSAASHIVGALWSLMEGGMEELKLLQTATLLITTTTNTVQHELLAKVLVLCFRLHCSKDATVSSAAAATVRQLVSAVLERVVVEDQQLQKQLIASESSTAAAAAAGPCSTDSPELTVEALEELKTGSRVAPKSLQPAAGDAFLLFQDFCQLLNADQPYWLQSMTEITRTLCLELMEEVLLNYQSVFLKHKEFGFLLTEKVCPLVIKLFSPSLKYRTARSVVNNPAPASQVEKPCFAVVMRLLRVVSVLIRCHYLLLTTQCEIFLSLLVKFLDPEKPQWQRAATLEVFSKLCSQSALIRCFCESYDMKPHSTKILRDIINGLSAFIQSQFMNASQTATVASGTSTPSSSSSAVPGGRAMDTSGSSGLVQMTAGGVPILGGVTPQPGFTYRNTWIPLLINVGSVHQTNHRPMFLDMLDKLEAPPVPEGYGLSLSFLCIVDVITCIHNIINNTVTPTIATTSVVAAESLRRQGSSVGGGESSEADRALHEELINSSWCGALAALSMLLDGCSDEAASEAILKCLQGYASICGRLQLVTPRDAFITALCKSSLPPHYTLHVLNSQTPTSSSSSSGGGTDSNKVQSRALDSQSGYQPSAQIHSGTVTQTEAGPQQVVAVGVALPSIASHVNQQQGPVMLTAKNIQCMRALLSLAHCHGGVLGTAWHQVLTTLQHLVWILGLKPSAGGTLRPQHQASENPSAVITGAVLSDMPVLSAMLSRLFESSQYLDDVALHHLLDALCKLSSEAMEVGYANREPSLFAVAKLLETGLVNLSRLDVLWRPVTSHLLEVCQHPHQGLRCWAGEAVTALVKAAIVFKYTPQPPGLQQKLLAPLDSMSAIHYSDVRQKQLESVLSILQGHGDELSEGWSMCLNIIGAVTRDQGENLIRIAFQSVQLVVTDFLPTMSSPCLEVCVDVAARFGLQNQDLNISLTAVGLLWNIADFFSQHKDRITTQLTSEGDRVTGSQVSSLTTDPALSRFDGLWMVLYERLGELCVDVRPAVRKSAGQTLFSMLSAHGSLLQQHSWHTVLWKVLFPLLEKVKSQATSASVSRDDSSGGGASKPSVNILMHHSRDTAEKQWAETRFLTLAGVARVFNMKYTVLQQLGEFLRSWALLLDYIESAALCNNAEVALAALKSFQELLNLSKDSVTVNGNTVVGSDVLRSSDGNKAGAKGAAVKPLPGHIAPSPPVTDQPGGKVTHGGQDSSVALGGGGADDSSLWSNAWRVWRNIGTMSTAPPEGSTPPSYIPNQAFLTALVQTFPVLYPRLKRQFVGGAELEKLFTVLQRALAVPVHSSATPFILPVGGGDLSPLTPLQDAVLASIDILTKDVMGGTGEGLPVGMYPDLFDLLLNFVQFAVQPPRFGKMETRTAQTNGGGSGGGGVLGRGNQGEYVSMNYVPFSEAVMELIVELYKTTAKYPTVLQANTLQHIITALRLPLGLKYACPSQSTWLLSINSLLTVLTIGLPIALKNDQAFQGMWLELSETLDAFLFTQQPMPQSMSMDDFQKDEAIDCRVIHLIRDDILPHSSKLPKEFSVKIMTILNKGSIHSISSSNFIDVDSNKRLREEFAKICFETLLQFSFISSSEVGGAGAVSRNKEVGGITNLAIESLLTRCKAVLEKYISDERLSGKCPLPRPRMSEMSFVLKAISTLLTTLKRTQPSAVSDGIWDQVIDLYPALVECTTSTSSSSSSSPMTRSLRDALLEYRDLLSRPAARAATVTHLNGTAAST